MNVIVKLSSEFGEREREREVEEFDGILFRIASGYIDPRIHSL